MRCNLLQHEKTYGHLLLSWKMAMFCVLLCFLCGESVSELITFLFSVCRKKECLWGIRLQPTVAIKIYIFILKSLSHLNQETEMYHTWCFYGFPCKFPFTREPSSIIGVCAWVSAYFREKRFTFKSHELNLVWSSVSWDVTDTARRSIELLVKIRLGNLVISSFGLIENVEGKKNRFLLSHVCGGKKNFKLILLLSGWWPLFVCPYPDVIW